MSLSINQPFEKMCCNENLIMTSDFCVAAVNKTPNFNSHIKNMQISFCVKHQREILTKYCHFEREKKTHRERMNRFEIVLTLVDTYYETSVQNNFCKMLRLGNKWDSIH